MKTVCPCSLCVYWSRVKTGCLNPERQDDWKAQIFQQVADKNYKCPSLYVIDEGDGYNV